MARRKLAPVHPGRDSAGRILLTPLGVSQYRLANEISVPPRRVYEIVKVLCSVTADTCAARLARYFGPRPASGSTCKHSMI